MHTEAIVCPQTLSARDLRGKRLATTDYTAASKVVTRCLHMRILCRYLAEHNPEIYKQLGI